MCGKGGVHSAVERRFQRLSFSLREVKFVLLCSAEYPGLSSSHVSA